MVPTIQATQAREGIDTSREQAERAYYVVTEGERATFFDLARFHGGKIEHDRRQEMFVRALAGRTEGVRFDIARSDFSFIEGSLITYRNIAWLAPLFRDYPSLDPTYGATRSGLNTTEIGRFTRQRWEVEGKSVKRTWVLFAKGGDFARFYADWDLVFDWTDEGRDFKQLVASKYGSASRFVKSEGDYFKTAITWMQTTNLGINARVLPSKGIFGVASPSFFPTDRSLSYVFLAIMNSEHFDALAHCVASRNWGATAIGGLPVPPMKGNIVDHLSHNARAIYEAKAAWDSGNEVSSGFVRPWLVRSDLISEDMTIAARLEYLIKYESAQEENIRHIYDNINDLVYRLYAIPDATRVLIRDTLVERPSEVLWPQMAGRTADEKRMEHVFRLLSYSVKCVIESCAEGIVPFVSVLQEPSLVDRIYRVLHELFPRLDPGQVEIEFANELRKTVRGYRRTTSISEWLANAFFEYHCGLYKSRPIIWHVASAQGTTPFAFGALVSYLQLDMNRMAKLRGQYLREVVESLRREAALADKAGDTEHRLEWQARLEEAQELDRRLQWVQEGRHEGPLGGDRDYRILTPWKAPKERPKGWDPDFDDGVKVNIEPLQKSGVLRISKVV